jgi:hypothetical protein
MIRGGSASRQVTCYSSSPQELQPLQASLALPAGGALELDVRFRSHVAGQRKARLHVVDPATGELVAVCLVTADVRLPQVTRTFEVRLSGGRRAPAPCAVPLSPRAPGAAACPGTLGCSVAARLVGPLPPPTCSR